MQTEFSYQEISSEKRSHFFSSLFFRNKEKSITVTGTPRELRNIASSATKWASNTETVVSTSVQGQTLLINYLGFLHLNAEIDTSRFEKKDYSLLPESGIVNIDSISGFTHAEILTEYLITRQAEKIFIESLFYRKLTSFRSAVAAWNRHYKKTAKTFIKDNTLNIFIKWPLNNLKP